MLTKNQAYLILWIDIQTDNDSWKDSEKIAEALIAPTKNFRNVGYYVGENDDYYFFTSGFSNEMEAFDLTQFPKGCIKQFIPIANEAATV